MSAPSPEACATCPAARLANLKKLGVDLEGWDHVIALAGNPNTGKSTVFNALTGLRQHTGNWPGKTVTRAEGSFEIGGEKLKVVDLPGTYSLLATSHDEEVARDFLLFGQPDVTVVVVDATALERNLNLALQVLEITPRVVICLNLMDEARRRGFEVDPRRLARDLGVPVVATAARYGEGLEELVSTIGEVARGEIVGRPRRRVSRPRALEAAIGTVVEELQSSIPGLPNSDWVALRLLDGDDTVAEALASGELEALFRPGENAEEREPRDTTSLFATVSRLRWSVDQQTHEAVVEEAYAQAAELANRAVSSEGTGARWDLDRRIDRLVTSRLFGLPIMLALLAGVFWLTIAGANVPSAMLAELLIDTLHPIVRSGFEAVGAPWWITGLLVDGMYLATAWVISVMLPPMAIFFPLFTLLEDFGYLPRVAFNLDHLFRRAGAHGKQALTTAMGFGCNAAGVIATRIIESPRERLIAVLTNNFALCNGRWPTQILVASIFVGGLVPAALAGLVSSLAVLGVAVLGILLTFVSAWFLSRTVLRGEASAFTLELPPYRPPRILQTLYTSLIDRTIFVLWRAIVFALPAGAAIWLLSNVTVAGAPIAAHVITALDPIGGMVGLSGIILLAYVIAIPANEIVVPTILMLTVLVGGDPAGVGQGAGVLFELDAMQETENLLRGSGWTLLMAVNLMIFSLVHNPCSTTIYTIWKETRSVKWTAIATLMPLGMGFGLCFVIAQVWRLFGG